MTRVKYGPKFLDALERLDRTNRTRALKAVDKFIKNPSLPGLNLEKLPGLEGLWSIRFTQGDRILLSKGEDGQGEVWTLHDAGPHNIYRRAGR